MLRRNVIAASAMLPLAAFAANHALAQDTDPAADSASPEGPVGEAEMAHAQQTGMAGSLSLLQSRMAATMATDEKVKKFAMWEVAEQETIGDILKAMGEPMDAAEGALKPPSDEEAMAMLDDAGTAKLEELSALTGAEFDRAYVAANLEGHQTLLAIQEEYLTAGTNREHLSVAKLARGMITEHIDHLEELQSALA